MPPADEVPWRVEVPARFREEAAEQGAERSADKHDRTVDMFDSPTMVQPVLGVDGLPVDEPSGLGVAFAKGPLIPTARVPEGYGHDPKRDEFPGDPRPRSAADPRKPLGAPDPFPVSRTTGEDRGATPADQGSGDPATGGRGADGFSAHGSAGGHGADGSSAHGSAAGGSATGGFGADGFSLAEWALGGAGSGSGGSGDRGADSRASVDWGASDRGASDRGASDWGASDRGASDWGAAGQSWRAAGSSAERGAGSDYLDGVDAGASGGAAAFFGGTHAAASEGSAAPGSAGPGSTAPRSTGSAFREEERSGRHGGGERGGAGDGGLHNPGDTSGGLPLQGRGGPEVERDGSGAAGGSHGLGDYSLSSDYGLGDESWSRRWAEAGGTVPPVPTPDPIPPVPTPAPSPTPEPSREPIPTPVPEPEPPLGANSDSSGWSGGGYAELDDWRARFAAENGDEVFGAGTGSFGDSATSGADFGGSAGVSTGFGEPAGSGLGDSGDDVVGAGDSTGVSADTGAGAGAGADNGSSTTGTGAEGEKNPFVTSVVVGGRTIDLPVVAEPGPEPEPAPGSPSANRASRRPKSDLSLAELLAEALVAYEAGRREDEEEQRARAEGNESTGIITRLDDRGSSER